MKFTKKSIYISLFGILYLIVAFSSFFHACAFFGLANNSWMSIILAFAFEVGQAAVLFSLLTSSKDRSRVMPWVLMTMFTLVQVIGNVYSSYKYIITNSVDNLRYFKEPIFIWTDLPDEQANVIIVYLVGALLPIAALLLTSMITNYLTDQSEENIKSIDKQEIIPENVQVNTPIITKDENNFINAHKEKDTQKDKEIENLKKQIDELQKHKLLNEHEVHKESEIHKEQDDKSSVHNVEHNDEHKEQDDKSSVHNVEHNDEHKEQDDKSLIHNEQNESVVQNEPVVQNVEQNVEHNEQKVQNDEHKEQDDKSLVHNESEIHKEQKVQNEPNEQEVQNEEHDKPVIHNEENKKQSHFINL